MLVKRAATLQSTLALKKLPVNGMAWHNLLLQGLPYASLRATAKTLGMKEQALAAHVGLKGVQLAARKRARRLQAPESDLIYAIALAFVRLAAFKDTKDTRAWLLTECEMLKGACPVDLLRTRLGTEYVMTAIDRMRPAPTFAKTVEQEEPEEDEEFA